MKLYHCTNARSLRPLWTLEELFLDYELVHLPFPPRKASPDYLHINSLGTVPTLMHEEVTLTESSAICQYLVEMHRPNTLGVDPTDPEYGAYLNWLHRSDATLTFPLTLILRYGMLEPERRRSPQVVDDYTIWFLSRLRCVEAALEDHDYLCCDRFTVADVTVHYALFLGRQLGLDVHYKRNCLQYLHRLMERSAFQRALARQSQNEHPSLSQRERT